MIEIKHGKKIFNIGDVVEISEHLAKEFFSSAVRHDDFKDGSRFFMKMFDYRKSNKMYYHFELLQIKDNMNRDISRWAFNFKEFSRDDLIFWSNHIIKVLDKTEIMILYLSNNIILLRRNYDN